ncbi:hypothetical protein [Dankookia sp. GCM10030260]|uniref:hypothetical protein n=1 Tax=Dankookia sp. GCM10030260 TaxID=3273390 RepID=UPI0036D264D2
MLTLLAACGGDRGCPAVLANASGQALEQFYVARPGNEGWGADLLPGRELPPGASLPFRFPAEGNYGLRAVWTNGRAVEMRGVEACRTTRVTLRDGSMQAE